MARRKTAAERQELSDKVAFMSARAMSNRQIAERLGIARNTVAAYLKEALADRDPGVDAARAEAIEHAKQVKTTIWTRIQSSGRELASGGIVPLLSPYALTGLLNTSLAAQDKVDALRGVKPSDRLEVSHLQESVADVARRNGSTPPERRLRLVDGDHGTGTDG